ncbi:hypothetical protein [Gorillibacterium sp. sgz5001074]|uniref:hypothetical protein n=1 Tax=Gorillibacterium sp. sgz5001074 TaxID=3446695 RepID=UPI003F66823A
MEEQVVQTENTGVESAPAAEVQEQVIEPVGNEPAGETNGDASPQNNFEKAFAKRLAEQKEKWEQEVSTKYAGYNELTEKAKQAEQYQANLDRVARFYGFEDHDSYMQAIEQAEHERQIQAEAAKYGVPEDFIRQELLPVKSELETLRREREAAQKERERIQQEESNSRAWGELFTAFPDVGESIKNWKQGDPRPEWHTEEFDKYMQRGYAPVDAYRLTNQERIMRQKEQEVLARISERNEKSLLPGNDRPSNAAFSMEHASFDDIKAISERVRRGERIVP